MIKLAIGQSVVITNTDQTLDGIICTIADILSYQCILIPKCGSFMDGRLAILLPMSCVLPY